MATRQFPRDCPNLLTLPQEILDQILELLLECDQPIELCGLVYRRDLGVKAYTSLSKTCRQLNANAAEIFFARNVFKTWAAADGLPNIRAEHYRFLRQLHVTVLLHHKETSSIRSTTSPVRLTIREAALALYVENCKVWETGGYRWAFDPPFNPDDDLVCENRCTDSFIDRMEPLLEVFHKKLEEERGISIDEMRVFLREIKMIAQAHRSFASKPKSCSRISNV